jgi:hypothetical protein
LWSHGYDFSAREADVRRIYAGTSDALELLKYYAIDYVYVGDFERQELHADEAAFGARFPIVYNRDGIKIYEVRGGGRNHVPAPREFASRVRLDPAEFLIQFPRIGLFLYRFYFDSLGRAPRYEEFIEGLEVLGRSLYVSSPGWDQRLEENKRVLLERWPRQSPPQQRGDDYDAAFLLMHYFGYLHRNPDDPPDNSLAGYDYWLGILKRTHDYRSLTRAFLESSEYRDRWPADAPEAAPAPFPKP